MKNCIFMVIIVSVSLNMLGSEKKHSVSDSKLLIPHQKQLRNSTSNLFFAREKKTVKRSPKVEMRLECFKDHANSQHDETFIQEVLASDDVRYPIYIELIKEQCSQCFMLLSQTNRNN